jgi:hypothetical protein
MEMRHIEKSRETLCRFWIEVAYGCESERGINMDKEGSDLKEVKIRRSNALKVKWEPHLVDIVEYEGIPPGYYGRSKGAM